MFPGVGGSFLKQGLYGALEVYGTTKLTVTSPPQSWVEPLTLAQVKQYCHIPVRSPLNPDEDAELNGYIAAARLEAEIGQGRDLVVKQWDLVQDYWIDYFIKLRDPLISVDLVQYIDQTGTVNPMINATNTPPSDIAVDSSYIVNTSKIPGVIAPPFNQMWPNFTPWPSSAVLVRFTSGLLPTDPWWQNDGQSIIRGMLMLVNEWYSRKLPFEQSYPESAYGPTKAFRQGGVRFLA